MPTHGSDGFFMRDESVVSFSSVAEHGGGRKAMPLVQTSLHSGGEGGLAVQCPLRSSSQLQRWCSQSPSMMAEHGGGRKAMPLVQTSLHSGGEGGLAVQCPLRSSSQLQRWCSQSPSMS
ncbi:hypothetical protein F2Q68_00016394 [Brassica cretica]|uniref:Uncharacterized protein n=1 Tax=Brassica cretica TaxID=69181 RepID=A0A8S9HNB4_BRACR|nr:hypothetical protein F2Q68_00016394 [Brassica cretica]